MVIRMFGKRLWVRLPSGRVVGDIGDEGPDLSAIERLMTQTVD
jgi:hypothetical protein